MLYSLLSFFGLQYFFNNYWISYSVAIIVLIIENTEIIKNKCGCKNNKKSHTEE